MAKKVKIDQEEFDAILESLENIKNGNFDVQLKSKDKKANELMNLIMEISNEFSSVQKHSSAVYKEISEGNLDFRVDSSTYKNGYAEILESINSMVDIPVAAIRDFNYAMNKLSKGYFDSKVSNNYLGEFEETKKAFNSLSPCTPTLLWSKINNMRHASGKGC